MKAKNNTYFTLFSNFLIVFMLFALVTLAFGYSTKVVFKEQKLKPIYNGNPKSDNVSLMFNVYWGTEYIDGILDVLDKYEAKCTFFVGGSWVEKNSGMLNKIYSKGHEIANHGYFHKSHDKLSYNANYNEIEPNNRLIQSHIGVRPTLFAPPSGAFNDATLKVSRDLKMKTIMWSRDTIDWRDKDTDLIMKRATKEVKGGDLILAHPTKCTLEALPMILNYYHEHNLHIVTVSENIR